MTAAAARRRVVASTLAGAATGLAAGLLFAGAPVFVAAGAALGLIVGLMATEGRD